MRTTKSQICVLFFFLAATLLIANSAWAGISFKSKNPRFAKLSVTRDDSKILLIAFDESKGTGKGYDTLYTDTNFNGKFEDSEKHTSRLTAPQTGMSYSHYLIELKTPFAPNIQSAGPMNLTWYHLPAVHGRPQQERFMLNRSFWPGRPSAKYTVQGMAKTILMDVEIHPSATLAKSPCLTFGRKPTVKVTTVPDKAKNGNTGIGVELTLGNWRVLSVPAINSSMRTAILIKDANGKIAHKGSEAYNKFGFG